ncbi:flagellar biosynthesis protein FlhA [Planctopirus limnophila DSM 3776]|uniref:Flagellar biosynthesis protein FlhA n=1 Tax=Planctopirus limnophila (strain ATCC 43296 / DSM 3776 / IFAM 1008 / Mu 290) TaxID=521674 RepID=D5STY8_PLAL2|nr:flagellar biosynthesis protein FlhA [Planctopirus limnophila]ADG66973.1 flagellar biosynthesis protein FlhA [Planctopirus limnophila DSM 3776]
MPAPRAQNLRDAGNFAQSLLMPGLFVMSILVIIAPLPPVVLDVLLAGNITLAVVILLTTIYVSKPLDFSVFPSLLLGTTLARLVLNVASTRLILTRANIDGTSAAGEVIEAFGEFVAGGQLVVGIILFVILVVIQFVVITKGSSRISEVAARFALDGMPGKQMAIDADLNAGAITQEVAKARRLEITQQADFYGAMDGAGKFVRGDAIAGIIITLINVLGGIIIGMFMHSMPFEEAIKVYTTLTIGDGLVSQVPAFLISLASGLLVTRSSSESNLSKETLSQLFRHSETLFVSSAFVGAMAFTGLPMMPLLSLSLALAVAGYFLRSSQEKGKLQKAQAETQEAAAAKPQPRPEDHLGVEPLEVELGFGLIRLADPASNGDLLDRVTRVRNKIAQELGLVLPKIRIRDNVRLEQNEYQIKLKDTPIAWGAVYPTGLMAIDTGLTTGRIPGMDARDPAFDRPAVWIEPSQNERAQLLGYSVVEPAAVIVTHLTEIVRSYADELLSRQQVHQLIDTLKGKAPKLLEDLVPDVLKIGVIHQVLANLLRERIPIKDLETILETLGDYIDRTKDIAILTEYVRHSLSRTICQQYRDSQRTLHVVTLEPAVEDTLSAGIEFTERGMLVKLSPQIVESFTQELAKQLEKLVQFGRPPVLLCGPQLRAGVRQMTSSTLPRLAVISLNEITRDTAVEPHGVIGIAAIRPARPTMMPAPQADLTGARR